MATKQILVVVDTATGEEQPVIEHAAWFAERTGDFLVMGAVARRGFKKLLLGSTAARVLDRLPCDLVIVKAGELALPRS